MAAATAAVHEEKNFNCHAGNERKREYREKKEGEKEEEEEEEVEVYKSLLSLFRRREAKRSSHCYNYYSGPVLRCQADKLVANGIIYQLPLRRARQSLVCR